MSKTKAHVRYETKDGIKVPGVTTVLGILNKPALVKWANNLGLKGIDSNKYRDKMADIGTLAHLMILEHLSGKKQDYSEYSKADIDKAENCLLSFFEWEKSNKIKPVYTEEKLVSELYGYGGMIDCFGYVNDVATLLDFKTGKAIYDEMIYQVAAYKQLLKECRKIDCDVRIIRIGRDEDEGFEDKLCKNLDDSWQIFFYCLNIYKLKNKIKDGSDEFYKFVQEESKK